MTDRPFIDLHCHLLPGVDDGPPTMDAAVALCKSMADQGVGTATATPHQSDHWPDNTVERIRAGVADLRAELARLAVPLDVLPGADIRVDADFMSRWKQGRLMSMADKGSAVLLELPDDVLLPLSDLSFRLRLLGVVPVLTHPERCRPLLKRTEELADWVSQGLVLQITTGSLLGEFGRAAEAAAVELVEAGWVGLFASDAHGADRRAPNHRAAFDRITEIWGGEAARKLMIDNPAELLLGRRVQPVVVRRPRRGFFSRWFG